MGRDGLTETAWYLSSLTHVLLIETDILESDVVMCESKAVKIV